MDTEAPFQLALANCHSPLFNCSTCRQLVIIWAALLHWLALIDDPTISRLPTFILSLPPFPSRV